MTKTTVERLAIVEEKVRSIEIAVSNHLPTDIAELGSKISCLDKKIDKINLRLAYASGALAVVIILAQLAVNKWAG